MDRLQRRKAVLAAHGDGTVTVTHTWERNFTIGDYEYPNSACQLCGKIGGNRYTAWYECLTCSKGQELVVCSDCLKGTTTVTQEETCSQCNGTGQITQATTCSHGKSSTHSYCSHGKTSQHDD